MPPLAPTIIERPLINGHEYSFQSLEVLFNGLAIVGIKSMNYKESLDPADVYGTGPHIIGQTRGKQKPSADCEMYRLEWEVFRASLGIGGQGYGDTRFPIKVTLFEPGRPVIVDSIMATRVAEVDASNSDGNDAAMVKLTFRPMRVYFNGAGIALPINIGF